MDKKRIMVFIDGSNFYHALKEKYQTARIDFRSLVEHLVGSERELMRVYYYNVPLDQKENPAGYKEQQRFFSAIRHIPYFEIRFGRLVKREGRKIEKGVDVYLATDMIVNAYKGLYDTAIIITGDADYKDAIQAVKDSGKHVELAYPDRCSSLSRMLLDVCDVYIPLDKRCLVFL